MLQMVNPSKSLYSTEQAVQWLSEIAEALQYMHSLTPAVSRSFHTLAFATYACTASCHLL